MAPEPLYRAVRVGHAQRVAPAHSARQPLDGPTASVKVRSSSDGPTLVVRVMDEDLELGASVGIFGEDDAPEHSDPVLDGPESGPSFGASSASGECRDEKHAVRLRAPRGEPTLVVHVSEGDMTDGGPAVIFGEEEEVDDMVGEEDGDAVAGQDEVSTGRGSMERLAVPAQSTDLALSLPGLPLVLPRLRLVLVRCGVVPERCCCRCRC